MKAQSHLEFMISLIVFVGFVIFIFYIVNPFSKPSAEINKISLIEKSILNNISDEVIIVKIIQGTNSGACYLTSEIDKFGNKWIKKQDGRIFTFYINNKFPEKVSDKCLTPDYTIAPEVKEDFIIFEDIVNFKSLYDNSYNDLIKNLGIGSDFNFKLKQGDNIILEGNKSIPKTVNVESKDILIRMINISSQEISEVNLNLRVW